MGSGIDLGIDQLTDAEVIGRGGFSTVYAADDTQFDRRVAVKVLRELSKDSDRNRFERECRVMGRLSSHPNVVTLYNAGYTDDDEPYMIMEFNEEGSLADVLEAEGPLPWRRALELMIPVLRALHHAHEAGVLHRDVKPENVLLADGVPRLTDFGIAYLRDSTGATSTSITASWLHTAPETFDNRRDERSDVYSAASTLYNLIAGRAPFENPDDESLNPLMRRLLDEAPPALPPGAGPAALSAYLIRALAKDPADRPATAADMADGLQIILDSGGLRMPLDQNGELTGSSDPSPLTPDPGPGRPSPPNGDPYRPATNTRSMLHQPPPVVSPGPASHSAQAAPPPDPNRRLGPPPSQPQPNFNPAPAVYPGRQPQTPLTHPPATPPASTGGTLGRTMLVVLAVGTAVVIIAVIAGVALLRSSDPGAEFAQDRPDRLDASEGSTDGVPIEPDRVTQTTVVPASGFDPSDRPEVVLPTFDGDAQSLAELEDRWAQNRAAVVTALSADGYGVDDANVLHGPGNFTVDLNDCPLEWSETTGIDGSTIRIGQTIATSGSLAGYSNLSFGMEAYFDVINGRGGIDGRSIELVVRDDAYDVDRTIDEVEAFLTTDQVFAVTTLGSPNTLATYDRLNAACVPQPFVASSHPGAADPVDHPFTMPHSMTWATEAVLWGKWIEQNMADQLPVRVSALVMDNDFGLAYTSPFQTWVDEHPDVVSEFVTVPHDPTAIGLEGEMATVAAADADVFIAMTAGDACGFTALGGEAAGLGAEVRIMASVCRDPALIANAGETADGYLTIGGGLKGTVDPQYADDPYIAFVNSELDAAGFDPSIALYGNGFGLFGWTWVETLRIAAELPGGLTRSNFLLAARGMQLVHPMTVEGIPFAVAGIDDAHYIESSDVARFDAAQQQWILSGIISAEGETPNCPWAIPAGCTP